jgi:hypothetical protein
MKTQFRKNLGKYPIKNRVWLATGIMIFVFGSFVGWYCARLILAVGGGSIYAVEGVSLSQVMLTFWLFGVISGAGLGVVVSHFNERLASSRSNAQGS